MLFLDMKECIRTCYIDMKSAEDATAKTKARVDTTHLQLQNVLYEKTHLLKEIRQCQQFHSKDEELELVPAETFTMSVAGTATMDPHALMLARLDGELLERQRLLSDLEDLRSKANILSQMNDDKRSNLRELPAHLSAVVQAATPLRWRLFT